jgi:hypothetical protein
MFGKYPNRMVDASPDADALSPPPQAARVVLVSNAAAARASARTVRELMLTPRCSTV